MCKSVHLLLAGALILLGATVTWAEPEAVGYKQVVDAYRDRLKHVSQQVDAVAEAADLSARQILVHPGALLNVPLWEQRAFGEELINRPGSLAHAYPTSERIAQATPNDVVLLSVRSWQLDGVRIATLAEAYQQRGWRITLIASAEGRPRHLHVDHFIDNGAPDDSARHAHINALVNITLGWMWCAEYAGAMTRKGYLPSILMDEFLPGGSDHNREVQTLIGRHRIVPCNSKVKPGVLARRYVQAVDVMLGALESPAFLEPMKRAADLAARRMAEGANVGLAGDDRFAEFEMFDQLQAPWRAFHAGDGQMRQIDEYLQQEDMLVWLGYIEQATHQSELAEAVETLNLHLITFNAALGEASSDDNVGTSAALHVRYPWRLPDGQCRLPTYPAPIGAISGLVSGLTLRMLDAEVARRLADLEPDGVE